MNYLILVAAAAIALLVGFVWYHPKVMGTAWMKSIGMDPNAEPTGNMAVIMGSAFVMAFFIASMLTSSVIHQTGVLQLVATSFPDANVIGTPTNIEVQAFLDKYGTHHRNFGHGFFHGILMALFFAVPVLGINALFERRGFKYIAIHAGYWLITLGLMGGVLCQYYPVKLG